MFDFIITNIKQIFQSAKFLLKKMIFINKLKNGKNRKN